MRLKKKSDGEIICMNEEELKKLWQSEQTAPMIDFAELQKIIEYLARSIAPKSQN